VYLHAMSISCKSHYNIYGWPVLNRFGGLQEAGQMPICFGGVRGEPIQ
jgi:hypothetical protein